MSSDPNSAEGYDRLNAVFARHRGTLNTEEAFYAILACAVMADDVEHENEVEELKALAHRTRTLHKVLPGEYARMQEKFNGQLRTLASRNNMMANAARSIVAEQKEMANSVYAHACDIVFADAAIVPSEEAFLRDLAKELKINPDDALKIIEVIQIKNEF